jgi:hypothetical protein
MRRRLMRSPCCLCIPSIFFAFYAVRVVSKENRRLVLPRTSSNIILSSRITTSQLSQKPNHICRDSFQCSYCNSSCSVQQTHATQTRPTAANGGHRGRYLALLSRIDGLSPERRGPSRVGSIWTAGAHLPGVCCMSVRIIPEAVHNNLSSRYNVTETQ